MTGTQRRARNVNVVAAGALLAILGASLPVGAMAAGLNLGWKGGSACPTSILSYGAYYSPCDNSDIAVLVGSARVPSGLTQVVGEDVVVRLQSASPVLPPFWQLDASGCRPGSLLVNAVFTGFATGTSRLSCSDYWGTSATGVGTWLSGDGGPNIARLSASFDRPAGTAGPMVPDRQYYLFEAAIDGAHAAPDPANPEAPVCAGCEIPGCFILCWAVLRQPPGVGDYVITNTDQRNFVVWQDGSGTNCPGTGNWMFCPDAPTAARRSTWGQIRSLYR